MQALAHRRLRYPSGLAIACAVLAVGACRPAETASRQPAAVVESPSAAATRESPVVLFLGTSLTAGYGLPADEAFPALVQQRIDAAGLDFRVVNAGVSGDTSAGGLRRIDWLLRAPVAVLVLELGANDMLRGQSVEVLERNLREIVARARAVHPAVRLLVAGMRAAPNLGARYVRRFEAVYASLAERENGALVPFLLEGVAVDPAFNQADGIHPNAAGHRRIADTVWQALEPLLRQSARG
jgi:acyl-CoA thioesterase-1